MTRLLLMALGLTSATVAIHAFGTVPVVLPLSGIWARRTPSAEKPAAVIPLTRLVSGLLLLHLVEVSVWAAAFTVFDLLPDFETSMYFSLTSFTTVGYGDVVLPAPWRLAGPIEAAVGVLMFGWSTGFIVAAVDRIYRGRLEPPST